MATITVRNSDGDTRQAPDEALADAAKDGYMPVVSNGTDERRVSPDQMHLAVQDGFYPLVPKPSPLVSMVRNLAQSATGGFSDEMSGGLDAAGRAVGLEGLGSRPVQDISVSPDGPTLDPEKIKSAYQMGRDHERQMLAIDSNTNPIASGFGKVAGMIASPLNKIAPGANMAEQGMILGGVNAAGNNEDMNTLLRDVAFGMVDGALLGGATEKYVAPYISKGATAVGNELGSMGNYLAYKATGPMLRDVRAVGPDEAAAIGKYALDNKIVGAGDSYETIAQKAMAARQQAGDALDSVYKQASEKFGDVINRVGFDPTRDKGQILAAASKQLGDTEGADAAISKLSTYLDQVAARHGDAPNDAAKAAYQKDVEAYLPKLKVYQQQAAEYENAFGQAGANPKQPVLSGLTDDLQRTQSAPSQVQLNGAPASIARARPGSPLMNQDYLPDLPTAETAISRTLGRDGEPTFNGINPEAVARTGANVGNRLASGDQQAFLNQHSIDQLNLFGKQGEIDGLDLVPNKTATVNGKQIVQGRGQVDVPMFPEEPTAPTAPQDIRNPMDPRRANNIKTAIDRTINYSRNPILPDPAKEIAFAAARKVVAQKVDDAIENLGGDKLLTSLKSANRNYALSNTIADTANDRVSRETANNIFGLSDHILGAAALAKEAPVAIPVVIAKKLADKYGTTTMAVGFDRTSKFLLQDAGMKTLAKTNPQAFQATALNVMKRLDESGGLSSLLPPKAADQPQPQQNRPANDDQPPMNATKPAKGPDKWAGDGFDNLLQHSDDAKSLDRNALMQDPKAKQLLIAASDLKPGSKAMQNILEKIQKGQK